MPPAGPPGPLNETTLRLLKQRTPFPKEISEPSTHIQKGQARGTWQALVILIDFPDYRWYHQNDANFNNADSIYSTQHFKDMLFSVGTYKAPYSQSDTTGSMRDFYLENSYGEFEVTGVSTVWYTAPENLAFYANDNSGFGLYPNSSRKLVEEAVVLADPDVDFSEFDNNNDGLVDALFVVHAGPGAEEIYSVNFPDHEKYLWSHKASISTMNLDGVSVKGYTLEPENGTIGVFCHEFGHALGLPDLYDTDGSSEGIGEWGLMASGGWCYRTGDPLGTSPSHFTAWSKERLGWIEPIAVTENVMQIEIPPVESNPIAYRLWTNGQTGGEYFLVENRQNLGFDAGLTRRQKDFGFADSYGLVVYHIDNSGRQSNENRRIIDVEEASPHITNSQAIEQLDLERILPTHEFLFNGNRGDNGDPFPGFSQLNNDATDYVGARDLTAFDESSIPNSNSNNGFPTGVAVTNIQLTGQNIVADFFVEPVTSVEDKETPESSLPNVFVLEQNYPNPFNPVTTIEIAIPASVSNGARIQLEIFNLAGERVRLLLDEVKPPGRYSISWNGASQNGETVASGIYAYRITAGSFVQTRKMIFMK
ncbi:M6 family metalloprotease domain-containing protein [candidate division KSB1 bacterium]|nr:M6 family metalloprotease domain-containing protein [candidate division KSB1 bacterium]